jgi:hypothetical protein
MSCVTGIEESFWTADSFKEGELRRETGIAAFLSQLELWIVWC